MLKLFVFYCFDGTFKIFLDTLIKLFWTFKPFLAPVPWNRVSIPSWLFFNTKPKVVYWVDQVSLLRSDKSWLRRDWLNFTSNFHLKQVSHKGNFLHAFFNFCIGSRLSFTNFLLLRNNHISEESDLLHELLFLFSHFLFSIH